MPTPQTATAERRCMVNGCPQYGIWQPYDEAVTTAHPDSHYSRNHAPEESRQRIVADSRGRVIGRGSAGEA